MLRLPQVQKLLEQPGLFDNVAARLGYRHLDWISKDTDNQFRHFPRHYVQYDIPDANDTYQWAEGLTEALKTSPGYTAYNSGLNGSQGLFMFFDGSVRPNPDSPSGWSAFYTVAFVPTTLPL